jgi:CRISPR-associated endonuclease/helicase Cas3
MSIENILRCWGKSFEINRTPDYTKYKPALYHMIDTYAVTYARLKQKCAVSSKLRQIVKRTFRYKKADDCYRYVAFLVALHDLGKISYPFQDQVKELFTLLIIDPKQYGGATVPMCPIYHAQITQIAFGSDSHNGIDSPLLPKVITKKLGFLQGGHHGFFDGDRAGENESNLIENSGWALLRSEAFALLAELFQIVEPPLVRAIHADFVVAYEWLCVMSDWLASTELHFPNAECETGKEYHKEDLYCYFEKSKHMAHKALKESGMLMAPKHMKIVDPKKQFKDIFSGDQVEFKMNELQGTCDELIRKAKGRQYIMIIEDSTGGGKTESGLWSYLNGNPQGFYIGLPTQATSNMMVKRVSKFLSNACQDEDGKPFDANLHLVHSMSKMAEFNKIDMKDQDWREKHDGEANVRTPSWYAQNSRKAVLAPYGVGTIDQILMSVLKRRHFTVRLGSLIAKTLIGDEVHAYDAYMEKVLQCLIEWLRYLGGNVILQSATLPRVKREDLLKAFGVKSPKRWVSYPRVTIAYYPKGKKKARITSRHIKEPESKLMFESMPSIEALLQEFKRRIVDGGRTGIIRHTIRISEEAYHRAKELMPDVEILLLNSTFPQCLREMIEHKIIETVGPESVEDRRGAGMQKKFMAISTQMLGLSLDIDFDGMGTDNGPIDDTLQIRGRNARYSRIPPSSKHYLSQEDRPAGFRNAPFWVIEPQRREDGSLDHGVSARIYSREVLDLSWAELKKRIDAKVPLVLPNEMDQVIDTVYCPEVFRRLSVERDKQFADVACVWLKNVENSDGNGIYHFDTKVFEADDEMILDQLDIGEDWCPPTRRARPNVRVVVVERVKGGLRLVAAEEDKGVIIPYDQIKNPDVWKGLGQQAIASSAPLSVYSYHTNESTRKPQCWEDLYVFKHLRLMVFENGRCIDDPRIRFSRKTGISIDRT